MANFYNYVRDGGFLSSDKMKVALNDQSSHRGSTFFAALMRTNVMPEEQLLQVAAEHFNLKRISNPYSTEVDFVATEKVVGDVFTAIEQRMFVVHIDGRLTFVVNDPENDVLHRKAVSALGEEPDYAVVSAEEFDVINQYQLTPRAISVQAQQVKSNAGANENGRSMENEQSASYTQKLLNMMIEAALDRRASDLHIQKLDDKRAQILFRVDGKIYHFTDVNPDVLPNLRNRLKTMSGVGGETPNKPVEGQISVPYNGITVDIRINIVQTVNGYDFCFRFISSHLKTLEELGLSEANYECYVNLLHMTKGLVILSGPVGSGKTSLLYAGFKKLLAEHRMVFTIEDPVEIVMPGVSQIDVKTEAGMSYAERFPSALRHDPDVIGIGETRTTEVGLQAIQAANTGHLVFMTLHTNDSVGAISRLVNLGIDPYTLVDVLAAVVAQRLVRRVCTECAEEYDLPENHEWRAKYDLGDGPIKLKRGCGCAACAGTGYRGRIAVNEIMVCSPKLRNIIQKGGTRTEMETVLENEGFKRYLEDAVEKAREGITTFEEVEELARDII